MGIANVLADWHRTGAGVKGLTLVPYADVNADIAFNVWDLRYHRPTQEWAFTIRSHIGETRVFRISETTPLLKSDDIEFTATTDTGDQLRIIHYEATKAAQAALTQVEERWAATKAQARAEIVNL